MKRFNRALGIAAFIQFIGFGVVWTWVQWAWPLWVLWYPPLVAWLFFRPND